MRQHKFKAWDKKRKRMYEVLHLHFNKFEGNWATVKGYDIIAQKDIHIQIQPQDIKLLEFTGLKDKNGKEIYEGDIVKRTEQMIGGLDITGEIKYYEGAYWIDDGTKSTFLFTETANNVVIGNVYDNPELLSDNND